MSCPECSTPTLTIVHTHGQVHYLQSRIAELEDALGNTVAALKHYGPFPYIADTRVVSEAEKLLGEAK